MMCVRMLIHACQRRRLLCVRISKDVAGHCVHVEQGDARHNAGVSTIEDACCDTY
jgi:hypothetical protein